VTWVLAEHLGVNADLTKFWSVAEFKVAALPLPEAAAALQYVADTAAAFADIATTARTEARITFFISSSLLG
jgi:hypothetical protein